MGLVGEVSPLTDDDEIESVASGKCVDFIGCIILANKFLVREPIIEEVDGFNQSSSRPKVPKNVGYLITPTKKLKLNRMRSTVPESQPPTFTPLKHRIEDRHLQDSDRYTWFSDIALLSKYLDPRDIQLSRLNGRLQQMALYDVYPKTEYLVGLKNSDKPEDKKVRSSKHGVDQSDSKSTNSWLVRLAGFSKFLLSTWRPQKIVWRWSERTCPWRRLNDL